MVLARLKGFLRAGARLRGPREHTGHRAQTAWTRHPRLVSPAGGRRPGYQSYGSVLRAQAGGGALACRTDLP